MARITQQAVPAVMAAMLVVGCTTLNQAEPVLDKYPGAKLQMTNYYNNKAIEDDWLCNEVQIEGIDKAQVIQDTPEKLILGVHYAFGPMGGRRDNRGCNGFGTRVFTFARAGEGYSLEGMSGPQR
jgi:hypothetical protein